MAGLIVKLLDPSPAQFYHLWATRLGASSFVSPGLSSLQNARYSIQLRAQEPSEVTVPGRGLSQAVPVTYIGLLYLKEIGAIGGDEDHFPIIVNMCNLPFPARRK